MKIALIKTKSEKITPLQDMNHPSIAKKTYKTKARRKFQISPLDSAQYENISSNNKSAAATNKNRYQENTTRLYPRNRPQHKPTENQVKVIKISN
jgi:hypothetical protein